MKKIKVKVLTVTKNEHNLWWSKKIGEYIEVYNNVFIDKDGYKGLTCCNNQNYYIYAQDTSFDIKKSRKEKLKKLKFNV